MGEQLLPCAHCGSPATFMKVERESISQGGEYIDCTNKGCGATSVLMFATGEDVKPLLAERWNRRAAALSQRAPISDAEILEALQIGLECAQEVADNYHTSMAGCRPAQHEAFDADVRKIETALLSAQGDAPVQASARLEVRTVGDGALDEVVGHGPYHLEQMSDGHWWMRFEDAGGAYADVNLTARGKIKATVEQSDMPMFDHAPDSGKSIARTLEQDFAHFLSYKGWSGKPAEEIAIAREAFEAAWEPQGDAKDCINRAAVVSLLGNRTMGLKNWTDEGQRCAYSCGWDHAIAAAIAVSTKDKT